MAMQPGVLMRVDHPLIRCRGAHNNAYLQPAALQALIMAVEQRDRPMQINSCLRTPMQQYLLHEQYKRGLCGISAAAPPPHSNHNSGLAIDIEDADGWKPFLARQNWRWLGAFDPVHFDYGPGGTALGALQVKAFQQLWNRHHPEAPLVVDGLWGPATATCVDRSPAQGFAVGPILRRGMLSLAVGRLQLLLRGLLALTPEQLAADCHYGPATERAVARFQSGAGLAATGVADAATISALERASGETLLLD